ncbi:DEAD/DEAH box helicase [Fulvivirga sp. M361]|uniref:DEAD/DEAH box helicase n=1 Tax=Fulvivirga sp. M361 TaxID=2594266 RepID=UPI001179AAF7|nr:DEAD/DEAH box helicase [Fulvivirga sp. M361]TRX51575.1 DEAD/DEAH box helicase [Fulvivirga sp. M361]
MESGKPTDEQLELYKSLFKVREDVFAIRWEKGNKKGYFPAYHFDPYMYKLHKMKGGTFGNYTDKTLLQLDDSQLIKHFLGEQHIGGYPLLEDNSSWFIAADFDGSKWKEESLKFLEECNKNNIHTYLERSQSGNGSHVWIFFDQSYPAIRSRKVITQLLQEIGIFSVFDKTSSFDRLFPNQDFHSGKGLGNLIALPLHGKSRQKGNSCFIDPQTFEPFENQWKFLTKLKKVDTSVLDSIYKIQRQIKPNTGSSIPSSSQLEINLDNQLHLKRTSLKPEVTSFLKDELNIANSEFFIKKKSGRNTWDTKRYFKLIEDQEFEVIIPRGFTGRLIKYLRSNNIDYQLDDLRKKRQNIIFQSNIHLLKHQDLAIESVQKKDFGIIVAPPGSGKTVIGLKIIAEKQQPALIVVHRKQLADQWVERIQAFLNIPKAEIGIIGSGKNKVGKQITVAMIQSLAKKIQNEPEITNHFGALIVDECHHIPSETFANTISKLDAYYQYGLTATPFRKYSDGKLIFIYLGEVIAEIKPSEIESFKRARIIIRDTDFEFPFNPKTDTFETLSKVLVHDTSRNKLILNDIISELKNGQKCIVITERKEHIETLNQLLKQHYESVALSGDHTQKERDTKWKRLKEGDYQVLITTGQFFGEGTDLQNASRLFLAYPFSFKGKLIQYIGRVQRSEVTPVIYDYHDHKIDYLHRLFLKRNVHYRHLDRQASFFDDPVDQTPSPKDLIIDKAIRVSIADLDFQYGLVVFKYMIGELKMELDFEIEHLNIRPEFDVLKSYFSKILNSKTISIHIHAEFQGHLLVAQNATSDDLLRINQEVIDSVKFRFIEKRFLSKKISEDVNQGFADLSITEGLSDLYGSEEEILEDILKNQHAKHFRQLKYLASMHERDILKLRFVLSPFSFVFLIAGNECYHLVLETLDTEEATYVWHINKYIRLLKNKLGEIDRDIETIRNKGRQFFLEQEPVEFSRVLHDYSDERKGFVVWKDQLEERLV